VVRDYVVSAQVVDRAESADISAESDCLSRPVIGRNADVIPVVNDVDDDACVENIMSLFNECECSVVDDASVAEDVTVVNVQFDLHRFVADSDVSFHFVDLKVRDDEGNTVQVNSLFDSRTQLSVLRQEHAKNLQYDVVGEVKLRGFDGSMSVGQLTVLPPGHQSSKSTDRRISEICCV